VEDSSLRHILEILKGGGVIAWPSDTTWALLARADSPLALQRVYEIKQRPAHKPFQLLVADESVANELLDPSFDRRDFLILQKAFWPGPLTLVAPAAESAPAGVVYRQKVGVRLPDDEDLRRLLRGLGGYAAATSLNVASQRPAGSYRQALMYADQVDVIVAGKAGGKPASTVFELPQRKVLRPGALTRQQILAALEEK